MEKSKVTISERDYLFLLGMNKKFKYIGRDKNGMLWGFERKPNRSVDRWSLFWDYEKTKINTGLFMNIRWEDEQVYLIEELINDREEEMRHA